MTVRVLENVHSTAQTIELAIFMCMLTSALYVEGSLLRLYCKSGSGNVPKAMWPWRKDLTGAPDPGQFSFHEVCRP